MPESTPTPKSESTITHDLEEYPEGTLEIMLAWIDILLDGGVYVGDPKNTKRFPSRPTPDESSKHPRICP